MASEADIAWWTSQSGRDWDQACQAYISQICSAFGELAYFPASAIDAYYASGIVSYDAYSCPPGGIIWLDIGTYGHVMLAVDSSDGQATRHLQVVWGINAGTADLAYYCAQTGARPLGWSWDSAGSYTGFVSADQPGPAPIDYALLRRRKEDSMYIQGSDKSTIYCAYSDPNGKLRLRVCGPAEAAFVIAGGLIVSGDDPTLTMIGEEAGYVYQQPNPLPVVVLDDVGPTSDDVGRHEAEPPKG